MIDKPPRVWKLVLGYWLAQPIAITVVLLLWIGLVGDDDQMYGAGFYDARLVVTELEFWLFVLMLSAIVTAAQAIYLWPARKPGITTGQGRSLRMSIAVAGLVTGLGGLALTAGVVGLLDEEMRRTSELFGAIPTIGRMMLWVVLLLVLWAMPSLVMLWFCRAGRRETVLSRLANRILLGTAAEAVLLIPLDALVRRRSDCYCAEGSFWGLTLLGLLGFIGLGPVVLLPLFAKRRRGWYRTHCNACGYDMSGDANATICPECGAAWHSPFGEVAGTGDETTASADHPHHARDPDDQRAAHHHERHDPVGGGG